MSALAGIVRFDGGPADAATVARMIDSVEHRGRDRRDVRADGAVTLAYRWQRTGRAQPVDEQPLFDRLARTALVFDGRLDNRPELASDLDLRDDESVSDAAFVMAAYRRWAGDMLPRLLGDFALALWDGRERRLMLARDPRGVRSLSYGVAADGCVAFATEPRQLLCVSGIDASPNLGFFAERLTGIVSHPADTIFRSVQRVPAAHVVTATPAGVAIARHWDIDPGRELRYADDAQYAEHLRALCERAVAARLRGLDRAAVLLSSGLDSSSVVAIASRANPGGRPVDVRAYNHAFPESPEADEGPGARRTAAHFAVPIVFVALEPASPERHLERAGRIGDTIPGALGVSDDVLAARIGDDGCRAVLTGVGGDEWLGGAYLHTADLIRSGRLVAGARQLWLDAHNPDAFHSLGVLARSCGWALTPEPVKRAARWMRPTPDRTPPGFARAFADQVALADRIAPTPLDERFPTLAAAAVYRAAMHPHGIYAWEESARQLSLFGCELAAPLLDRRIAEFAMAVPEEQRWAGAQTKRVLRAAMTGILPDDVRIAQAKLDPGAVVFAEVERLHREGTLSGLELTEAGMLDGVAVDAMFHEMVRSFASGQNRYKVLAYRLWTFFICDCVWRTLFGRDARSPSLSSRTEVFSGERTASARCG
jgi:asparagine synthase (glutamine-hydrolysing)